MVSILYFPWKNEICNFSSHFVFYIVVAIVITLSVLHLVNLKMTPARIRTPLRKMKKLKAVKRSMQSHPNMMKKKTKSIK